MRVKSEQIVELMPMFDSRASFYHKATVQRYKGGHVLYSYETPVAYVGNHEVVVTNDENDLTATTLRHVKEFLKQYAGVSGNKQQLVKQYGGKISLV